MRTENWPMRSHATGCGCDRCAGRDSVERLANASLSAALRHAQNRFEDEGSFEAATPAGALTLPGRFSGWKEPTTLDVVIGPNAPAVFTQSKPRRLYRIYEEGRQKPLYIGMAFSASIRNRVMSHIQGIFTKSGALSKSAAVSKLGSTTKQLFGAQTSEVQKLRILVAQLGLGSRVKVQHAAVEPGPGYTLDPKFLHAFEIALQVLERPRSYVGTARTFELDQAF
jgi:hypothetical protein